MRLAEAARRPQDVEKKLEQEIASRQRQVARLTERLENIEDAGRVDGRRRQRRQSGKPFVPK